MNDQLLQVNNLRISFDTYAGEVYAVRGASFDVKKGEVLAIVGESGSGKSVMTQTILRLLPSPPCRISDGEIIYDGKNLLELSEKEMQEIRGGEIGVVFQDAMTSLNPTMRIGRQITESILKHQKINRNEAKAMAVDLLTQVGIPNPKIRVKQHIYNLSGGMRQRAMLAVALACNPRLLIADEPTTALDVTIQAQIMELITEMARKRDVSIILITHDLGVVASNADRIVVMYAGHPVEMGTCTEIFSQNRHPYTEGLLAAIPHLDAKSDEQLVSIPGSPPNLMAPPKGCAFASRCKYAMKICYETTPEKTQCSDSHYVYCHLENPMAAGIREMVLEKEGVK